MTGGRASVRRGRGRNPMRYRVARHLSSMGLSLTLLAMAASACTTDSTGPSPVPQNETFTGTLQPQGYRFQDVHGRVYRGTDESQRRRQ